VKLLLDENLSRRLVPFLQERFPDTSQVALLGLERASDVAIWEFAKVQRFVIVSCDSDMEELSVLRGAPPQVIVIKGTNPSKAAVLRLLTDHATEIHEALEINHSARVDLYHAT
jgi:predicted nuclease of predicted toxin-antitoxin system